MLLSLLLAPLPYLDVVCGLEFLAVPGPLAVRGRLSLHWDRQVQLLAYLGVEMVRMRMRRLEHLDHSLLHGLETDLWWGLLALHLGR